MKPETIDQTTKKAGQRVLPLCDSLINVEISDVLTPVSCGYLINEILQGLLYQKSQIPYPYSWLKSVITKKRERIGAEEAARKINFSAANHFRIVSTAYDTLESIMRAIVKEFSEKSDCINEIVFIFGATPQCPKEIYTIKISSLSEGHLEKNHASPMCKCRQKILRNIFLSQYWLDAVDNSMACTNTYIFLKKSVPYSSSYSANSSDNYFIPSRPLTFPSKTKHIKINLNCEPCDSTNCCDNFFVFEDISDSSSAAGTQTQIIDSKEIQQTVWYQSKDLFKGFKDCYINKVSASELW